jgi:hypothetical protein
MSTRDLVDSFLRDAEETGRTLTDAEAQFVEAIAASEAPKAEAAPVTAPAPTITAEATPSLAAAVLKAVEDRQSFRVDAAAIYYDTVKVASNIPTVSSNRLAGWLLRHGAVDVGSPQGRTVAFPRLVAGNDAAVWNPGDAKAELPSELASVPCDVYAAFTQIYETARLDIPAIDGYLDALITRRVVAAENAGMADSLKSQATTSTVTATSGVEAIAAAIAQVESASPSSLVLLITSDVWAQVAGTGLVGQLGDGKYYEQTLMGTPYFIVPGVQSIIAVDCRSLGVAAAGPFVYVGPGDATKNEIIIRSETSAAAIVADPSAAGTIVYTGRSTVK